MELLNLINTPGWSLALQHQTAILDVPSHADVMALLQTQMCAIAATAAKLQGMVEIRWKGCHTPVRVTAEMAAAIMSVSALNDRSIEQEPRIQESAMMPTLNIDQLAEFTELEDYDAEIAQLAYSEKNLPVWIVDQASQEVLLANRAAITVNSKPPREILTKDISVLWNEDALRSLTNLINRDKRITDHTNIGWRWRKEEGKSIWVRVKHEFNVDYRLVKFLGLECRFEIVKNAVPV